MNDIRIIVGSGITVSEATQIGIELPYRAFLIRGLCREKAAGHLNYLTD